MEMLSPTRRTENASQNTGWLKWPVGSYRDDHRQRNNSLHREIRRQRESNFRYHDKYGRDLLVSHVPKFLSESRHNNSTTDCVPQIRTTNECDTADFPHQIVTEVRESAQQSHQSSKRMTSGLSVKYRYRNNVSDVAYRMTMRVRSRIPDTVISYQARKRMKM